MRIFGIGHGANNHIGYGANVGKGYGTNNGIDYGACFQFVKFLNIYYVTATLLLLN